MQEQDLASELPWRVARLGLAPAGGADVKLRVNGRMNVRIVNGYFGLCPFCHRTDGCVRSGEPGTFYVYICREHKVKWKVGTDLFSCWRDETPEALASNRALLESYESVEPWYPGDKPHLALIKGGAP
jgi:hypothetical protein